MLAGPSPRHWARQFLLWAIRQHLLDLPASAIPLRTPQAPPDVEDYQLRADLAHRLLHEEGIPVDIRVAGLLVVLYGQHLSRIASIERENVDLESTPPRIKLGKNWLELPDPMGRHITELLAQGPRRNAPFIENARWLFLPKTLARLLDLQTGTAVSWVNKAGGIYSNYWGQVLRDEEAEDPGLFDPGLEALEEDEDPEDLLDELGLI